MDTIATFFQQPTARRLLLVTLFLGMLAAFQSLLPMLAAYTVFVQVFTVCTNAVRARTRLTERGAIFAVLAVMSLVVGGGLLGAWVPLQTGLDWLQSNWAELPTLEAQLLSNAHLREAIEAVGGVEAIKERLHDKETLAQVGAGAASAFSSGKAMLVEVVMAFFLALLYVLDRATVDAMVDAMPGEGIPRTLVRWVGFLGAAFALTVQLQVVVALCNTELTLPVLMAMDVPNVGAVMVFTFLTGLIPVVGNYFAAVVLCALAWTTKGWIGIPVFLGLAVLLGKLESFYLTPRLARAHVDVPAFVLTLSLVVFEVQLGFIGLFLSFPFLYVLFKVRGDLDAVARYPGEGAERERATDPAI
jgi:predicted PurR-regulated permease PerM